MGRLAARAKNQNDALRKFDEVTNNTQRGKVPASEGCWGPAFRHDRDPRPDLQDDTHLWDTLFQIAAKFHPTEPEKNAEYTALLNYMRCCGTLCVAGSSNWLLRPLIDETRGWESQEAYDEFKKKLDPWGAWIKMSLKQLSEKYPVR